MMFRKKKKREREVEKENSFVFYVAFYGR